MTASGKSAELGHVSSTGSARGKLPPIDGTDRSAGRTPDAASGVGSLHPSTLAAIAVAPKMRPQSIDRHALTALAIDRLGAGSSVRQVERELTAQLTRREARQLLIEAQDQLALVRWASRLKGL